MQPNNTQQGGFSIPKPNSNISDYIWNQVVQGASEAAKRFGVPASVTLSQFLQETGGQLKNFIGGTNIFGVKGRGSAGSVNVPTVEYDAQGKPYATNSNFAVYKDIPEAIMEHAKLLTQNPAYAKFQSLIQKGEKNPAAYTQALQGVYATDPNYAKSLNNIIATHGFAHNDDHENYPIPPSEDMANAQNSARQNLSNKIPSFITDGIKKVGEAARQGASLPQQVGAVAGMNNQQAQDYRSQVDQTLPKIPVRPMNPSMPTPQMNSPYYGAMNTMSGAQDAAQSGLSKAVNPFQTGAEGLARLPAARSFSQGAQDVGDVASGVTGGLGMLHAGTTAAKGLYNNLGMVNNQSGAVSTNPFASGLQGPHANSDPILHSRMVNPTPGVFRNPDNIPANANEVLGGWGQGMKQAFDTALLNRDPATIIKLLPQVPNDYKVKFAQMIGQILGQGG